MNTSWKMENRTKRKAVSMQQEERRGIVASELLAGSNYRSISDALTRADHASSLGTISRDVEALRKEWRVAHMTDTHDWMILQLRRLDHLHCSLWDKAMHGDIPATNSILKIMAQRAKLLGLDREKNERDRLPEGFTITGINFGTDKNLD